MNAQHCIIDGVLRDAGTPHIPAYDRSFMLGDGLFETILVNEGRAVWLYDHLERMKASAAFFGIPFPHGEDEIAVWCAELIKAEGIKHGFLRIALSRGSSPSGRFADMPEGAPLLLVIGGVLPPLGEELPAITAALAPWPVNERDPVIAHKTASRMYAVHAKRLARERGVDELIFCNTRGHVAEGIFSNIFWVKAQELFTPSLECGILPGVARNRVIAAAGALGVKVREGAFEMDALVDAEEVLATNCLFPVARVVEVANERKTSHCYTQPIAQLLAASFFVD